MICGGCRRRCDGASHCVAERTSLMICCFELGGAPPSCSLPIAGGEPLFIADIRRPLPLQRPDCTCTSFGPAQFRPSANLLLAALRAKTS